jgi:TolB-like protein/DNA-binding SARP family transcriptional activator
MVSLRLFASASLQTERGALNGPAAQRRRLALLALLAASYPRAVPRDKILAYLWPERDSEHARNLLSQALYTLRKALGDQAIQAAGDELNFNPQVVACDAVSFEQAIEAGELARAVTLYSGAFLDGFFLSDAPEFESWVDRERERYRRAYGATLERLAEEATAKGDFAAAAECWRLRVVEEPGNARITRCLMEALEAAGDRAGALQQARIHAMLLAKEFDAEPDPEVTALAERLRTRPAGRTAINSEQREEGGSLANQPVPTAPAPADAVGVRAAPPLPALGELRPPRWPRDRRPVAPPAAVVLGSLAVLSTGWLLTERMADAGEVIEAAAGNVRGIAVLPCANLSGDPEQEYFSDGLTEELIGVLAQVDALQVVARTSAFTFKGENRDIREIGDALNVGTVLECSVRRVGERVRVAAQLINAADGFHLWSEMYEREGTDVFAIQSDLALRIVSRLEAELTPAERARLAHRPTENPEAHALYLKGRYLWNQRTNSSYLRAIEYFERAIEVDPHYAAAHAGIGIVYILGSINGYLSPGLASDRARQAARKAIELDPELAEAHVAMGGYLNVFEWDNEGTEREFMRSVELDPNYAYARHVYAVFLTAVGRYEEALVQRKKAVELDPLDLHLATQLGHALLDADRPEEALEQFRDVIELDSTHWPAYRGLGGYYYTTGRFEEAIHTHQRAVQLAPTRLGIRSSLAGVLAQAGRKHEARVILGELQAEAARTGIHEPQVASVLLALDDVDGALAWLERSYQQRHPSLRLNVLARLRDSPLGDDPRFLDLRRRVGLPR